MMCPVTGRRGAGPDDCGCEHGHSRAIVGPRRFESRHPRTRTTGGGLEVRRRSGQVCTHIVSEWVALPASGEVPTGHS